MAADWESIKAEYITKGTSYRALEKKYGINFATIGRRAAKEGWSTLRQQQIDKTLTETLTAVTNDRVDRAVRLSSVADLLLTRIETGITEARFVTPTAAKNYSDALKNLKDIHMIRSDEDIEEQRARIEKLHREADREDRSASITVTLEGEMASYGE